jgi:hypothetical protein
MALASATAQPQAKAAASGTRLLQRACACADKTSGYCPTCHGKKPLQRKAAGGAGGEAAGMFTASPRLTQGGVQLPAALRRSFAPLYGSNFADVRVHHGATSHAAAREVSARAFTLGQHIHFAAGEYRPHEREGQRLIAHELAHTLQQRGMVDDADADIAIDAPGSALEREADAAADAAIAGRPAPVAGGSARHMQAKLLQRQPQLGGTGTGTGTGIGSAKGGSETASLDRKVDENTVVHITRTVTEKPCTSQAVTKSEPSSDQIFYWDEKANAVGLRYSICRGRVQLSTKGEISYDNVIQSAKGLLTTLQNTPALGGNLPQLLQNRLDAGTISSTGEITLTVDGILQATVSGGATVGTGGEKFNVKGTLKVTPSGVSFALTGGVDVSKTPLKKDTTYQLQFRTATEFFAVTLSYEQIDTSRATGGPTTERKVTVKGEIPVPDIGPLTDVTVGPTLSVDPGTGKVTPGIGIGGKFGGPEKTPAVRCLKCDCPPPLPEYTCSKVVTAHTRTVQDQPARDRIVKLFYNYNSTVPANEELDKNVGTIADLVGEGFKVEHIRGYASPEGSLDAPKPPVAGFKGNIDLSRRRAKDARDRIAAKAAGASLPEVEGKGELLGDLDSTGDTPDKDLTPDLKKLLEGLSDEQQLEALGIDDVVRNDPARRADALARIKAFIEGRDASRLALAERPRWEKIFPFLRRVDVSLHHEAVTHPEAVPGGTTTGCDPDDLAYAKANMPRLPPDRQLPPKECEG